MSDREDRVANPDNMPVKPPQGQATEDPVKPPQGQGSDDPVRPPQGQSSDDQL